MLSPPRVRWDKGQPYNLDYGDIYHHVDGVDEVQRVFLEPSELGKASLARRSKNLVVGEVGFGTGLNLAVLAANAQQWLRQHNGQLHYISFEAHPFAASDFQRLASARQAGLPLYAELVSQYPALIPGWHRRYLMGGRIMLSLYYGDAAVGIADIVGRQQQPIDAWLLDGFAPDRNPALWTPAIYQNLRRLSASGTRVASFTAAGAVRRGLQDAGFVMQRVRQMPHKLHSLAGVVAQAVPGDPQTQPLPSQVKIVGGGIAGASIARHLAFHQIECEVFEAGAGAGGASRLPAALLHGRLLGEAGAAAQLRASGASYADALCHPMQGYRRSGVLQAAQTEEQQQRLAQVYAANQIRVPDSKQNTTQTPSPTEEWLQLVDTTACQDLANCAAAGGLLFPQAGIVTLDSLLTELLHHPSIKRRPFTPLDLSAQSVNNLGQPLVLACAMNTRQLPAAQFLELAPVAGQLDLVTLPAPPTRPVAGTLYQIPNPANPTQTWVGSTYEQAPWTPAAATEKNLTQCRQPLQWHHRARAIRCVTSDRWPVGGRLTPDLLVWVSVGHGSMGMVTAHQSAAIIASELSGHFAPLTIAQLPLVAAQRFATRQQRRGYRMGAVAAPAN